MSSRLQQKMDNNEQKLTKIRQLQKALKQGHNKYLKILAIFISIWFVIFVIPFGFIVNKWATNINIANNFVVMAILFISFSLFGLLYYLGHVYYFCYKNSKYRSFLKVKKNGEWKFGLEETKIWLIRHYYFILKLDLIITVILSLINLLFLTLFFVI